MALSELRCRMLAVDERLPVHADADPIEDYLLTAFRMDNIERGQVWEAIGYPGSQLTILSVEDHGVTFWRPGHSGVLSEAELRAHWHLVEPAVSRRRKQSR